MQIIGTILLVIALSGAVFAAETPAAAQSKESREAIVKEIDQNLKTLQEKIQELSDHASKKSQQAQHQLEIKIDDLKAEQKKIHHKLYELDQASDKAWGHMQEGIRSAIKKLDQSYEDAKAEYSK